MFTGKLLIIPKYRNVSTIAVSILRKLLDGMFGIAEKTFLWKKSIPGNRRKTKAIVTPF